MHIKSPLTPWLLASSMLAMYPLRHLLDHHAKPEGEGTAEPKGESEPKTIMPEIMTNQEAFLMYGVFIFALAVFCIVLLVLFFYLKKQ